MSQPSVPSKDMMPDERSWKEHTVARTNVNKENNPSNGVSYDEQYTSYALNDLHNTAIVLNNFGASFLEGRKYRLAMDTLRDTVELLSRQPARNGIEGNNEGALDEYVRVKAALLQRAESRLMDTNASTSPSREKFAVCGSSGALLVQTEPVLLRPAGLSFPHHFEQQKASVPVEEISAAVLHNLALAFHLLAASEYDNSVPARRNMLLDRAFTFYKMSFQMVLRILKTYGATSPNDPAGAAGIIESGGIRRLAWSYLNNTGQILVEHQSDHDAGRKCFHDLGILLQQASASSAICDNESSLDIYMYNELVTRQLNAAAMA